MVCLFPNTIDKHTLSYKEKGGKEMDPSIAQYFYTQGPWAVGFIWLLYWVFKENRTREKEMREDHANREDRLLTCLGELSQNYKELSYGIKDIQYEIKKCHENQRK